MKHHVFDNFAEAFVVPSWQASSAVGHGFFTRNGGASKGLYSSLNGGLGSADERAVVLHNRSLMAQALGVTAASFLACYQVHSARVVHVVDPWLPEQAPQADAMVSRVPGLALAVASADCGPLLFFDPVARVVGAAHAGWKGALGGVHRAVVAAMVELGARLDTLEVALGPMIMQPSYEVGPEFWTAFLNVSRDHSCFFVPSQREGHFLFDLVGFLENDLRQLGVQHIVSLRRDTYAEPDLFYSHRRMHHQGEADYGRLMSAIALLPQN